MMHIRLFHIIIWLLYSIPLCAFFDSIPAFPGAEGFGKYSKGGRGGEVILVTSLKDNGPGSLRKALETEGSRIIIFDISGTIVLETPIIINNPYVTIAGQTAPNGGIAIRGNMICIQTHDVIVRFVRFRPGDVSFGEPNDWSYMDGLEIRKAELPIYNIIIDHCSFSWATDENIGIWGKVENVTIQNSIISEPIHQGRRIDHDGMGILVGFPAENISIINNLFAHNFKRHPRLSNVGKADLRNNIIYNPGRMGINLWNTQGKPQEINIVRNIFIPGPNTNFEKEISFWDPPNYIGQAYIEGNIGLDGNKYKDNWDMVEDAKSPRDPLKAEQIANIRVDKEYFTQVTYTKTFEEMSEFAKYYIGASLPFRDPIDNRVISDWKKRTGKIISSQNEVGGWPDLSTSIQRVYTFNFIDEEDKSNGIPDAWLEYFNILPSQENVDFNRNGYTNIEEYLNGTNPRSQEMPSAAEIFKYWGGGEEIVLYDKGASRENKIFAQNFPNPFNEATTIRFSLKYNSKVDINIYDLNGRTISALVNSELFAGEYELIWRPDESLDSGLYIANILYGDNSVSFLMYYLTP